MTTLDELAAAFFALEANDKTAFQRRARVLQSIWRTERDYGCGQHNRRGKARPLGSRLVMPWAREALANFMTEQVREVVRTDVVDPLRSKGKLFGKPRTIVRPSMSFWTAERRGAGAPSSASK